MIAGIHPGTLLHAGLDRADYEITPTLRGAAGWKCRATAASDMGTAGQLEDVGYIMIRTTGPMAVIPIARSCCHQRGYATLFDQQYAWGISARDWVPIWPHGIGAHVHNEKDIPDFVAAFARWHAAGGRELTVEGRLRQGQGGPSVYTIGSHDFVAGRGHPVARPDGINDYGRRLIDAFDGVSTALAALRDKADPRNFAVSPAQWRQVRKAADILLEMAGPGRCFEVAGMPFIDRRLQIRGGTWSPDIWGEFRAEIAGLIEERDGPALSEVLFSHNGLKNATHIYLRQAIAEADDAPGKTYRPQAETAAAIYGDMRSAERQMAAIDAAPPAPDSAPAP